MNVGSKVPDRWQGAISPLALLALALLWTWHAGRDLNWDLFNYHLYAGFSVLHDRFGQDFFAAFPAYYTPYAHVPFYALVQSGLSSLAVALILTLGHGLILCLVHTMALRVSADPSSGHPPRLAILAALLALLNPVYLQGLGTSLIDISTGVPVVAAWCLLATRGGDGRRGAWALAGLLMGLATGLKLSNAIFAMATVPALMWLPGPVRQRLSAVGLFSAACASGYVLAAGPWAWRLYQEFGNPFFPMFNGIFRSPDFVTDGAALDRFLPRSFIDALSLPFRMVLPLAMIHVETASPDLRYAVLAVAGSLAVVVALYRLVRGGRAVRVLSAPRRALLMLATCLLLSWGLWLFTSGNSRYFIPAGSLAGVLLVGLAAALPAGGRVWAWRACLALVLVQGLQVMISATPRFAEAGWSERWIETTVPARYRDEPFFYFTLQSQSLSFLAPSFHPGSGFFNAVGGFAFDPDGPGGARAQALIRRFEGRHRTLISLDVTDEHGRFRVPDLTEADQMLLPWGFVVDRADCDAIGLKEGLPSMKVIVAGVAGETVDGPILNCGLKPATPAQQQAHAAGVQWVSPAFDRLESACPDLFKPRGLRVEGGQGRWHKSYTATDTRLSVVGGKVSYFSAARGGDPVRVGTIGQWLGEAGPSPEIDCSRRAGALFGGMGH